MLKLQLRWGKVSWWLGRKHGLVNRLVWRRVARKYGLVDRLLWRRVARKYGLVYRLVWRRLDELVRWQLSSLIPGLPLTVTLTPFLIVQIIAKSNEFENIFHFLKVLSNY